MKPIAALRMGDAIGNQNKTVMIVVGDVKNLPDGTADVPLARVADAHHADDCTDPKLAEYPSAFDGVPMGVMRCTCGAQVEFFTRRYIYAGQGAQISVVDR